MPLACHRYCNIQRLFEVWLVHVSLGYKRLTVLPFQKPHTGPGGLNRNKAVIHEFCVGFSRSSWFLSLSPSFTFPSTAGRSSCIIRVGTQIRYVEFIRKSRIHQSHKQQAICTHYWSATLTFPRSAKSEKTFSTSISPCRVSTDAFLTL